MKALTASPPRVGFICLDHPELKVFFQTPRLARQAFARLEAQSLEVYWSGQVAYTADQIRQSLQEWRQAGVEAVVVYVPDYFREEVACVLIRELGEVPVCLWSGYHPPGASIPISSLLIMASHMRHLDRRFFWVAGAMEEEATLGRMTAFCRGAAVRARLAQARVARIGGTNLGMLDTSFSQYDVRRLVPEILHLDPSELVRRSADVHPRELAQTVTWIGEKVSRSHVDAEALEGAVRAYHALRAMVGDYDLDGVAVRDWPDLGREGLTVALACALLNDEGIVMVQESDISSTVTGLALTLLGVGPAYVGELAKGNQETGETLLLHEGALPLSLADPERDILLAPAGTSVEAFQGVAGGVSLESTARPGFVTAAKLLGNPVDGRLKLLVTAGEVVAPWTEVGSGLSHVFVRFTPRLPDLLSTLIAEGFEHHLVLGYGEVQEELLAWARTTGVVPVIPPTNPESQAGCTSGWT